MVLLARFLHVRRTELGRTLQVAGFAVVLGWALYTAFNGAQAIFLSRSGPQAYPLFFIVLALSIWPLMALQGALTRRLGVGRTLRLNLAVNVVVAGDAPRPALIRRRRRAVPRRGAHRPAAAGLARRPARGDRPPGQQPPGAGAGRSRARDADREPPRRLPGGPHLRQGDSQQP